MELATRAHTSSSVRADLTAGLVVFIVALPLCLGLAMASNAPLIAGILAGIVGGILVGLISGSQTSVSGPDAGLTVIVAAQIAALGSFEAFLLAVVVAGGLQIMLGLLRAGFIAAFFPSSVVQGLLAAIGALLILKQIPHVLGRDTDPEGEMSFFQPDHQNTFSEILELLGGIQPGAAVIGLCSLAILKYWDQSKPLRRTGIPGPLVVVVLGVLMSQIFAQMGSFWAIADSHMVQVPVASSFSGFFQFLRSPDFSQWTNPAIYQAGLTIALAGSLGTLLNLEAVDRVDPLRRNSPPSRELFAQGVGNLTLGLIGGIPVTSVIVRSSVNINAGGKTKLSAVFHGVLMLVCVMVFPQYLNFIPLSCLAAILLITGSKLVSPQIIKQMWKQGRYQFVPFVVTMLAIILTDLVTGVLIGMAVSVAFILNSSLRRPIRRIVEKHLGGEVLHIVLGNQVSFLNRAALEKILNDLPTGTHVLLDAETTDYIDPDVSALIREFKDHAAPIRGIQVSVRGFQEKYHLQDEIQFVDYSTRQLQEQLTSAQVLQLLKDGNLRFLTGQRLTRDYGRQLHATSKAQNPIAIVLSCIDSRTPAEIVFDLGIGDIFSVRVAGNVVSPKVLGSLEYACQVVGSKLIVVMGHTRCGAVTAAVNLSTSTETVEQATGCQHLQPIIQDIQQSIDPNMSIHFDQASADEKTTMIETVAIRNVERSVEKILHESQTVSKLVDEGRVAVVGAIFDVRTGKIHFLNSAATSMQRTPEPALTE